MTVANFEPTLSDVISSWVQRSLQGVHTATWGTVESFDRSTCRATIQPIPRAVKTNEEGDRVTERAAILQNVPVCFVGIAGIQIAFDLPAGSLVVVIFMERSMDKFLTTGSTDIDPGDDRRFSVNDAIALPVLVGGGASINQASMVINAPRIDIGDDNLNPAQDGVLTGQTIDPFLGVPYYTIGGASTKVLAKK